MHAKREKTPEERARWAQGWIGERLVAKSDVFRRSLPKGCKYIRGHKPDVQFSNLESVMHLDTIALDPKSNTIRAIWEVKSTTRDDTSTFHLNGKCPAVIARALNASIPVFLAVVRLKNKPPASIRELEGAQAHLQFLAENPDEYSIEFYKDGEFEIRGATISIIKA